MSLSDDHKQLSEFRPKWEYRRRWIMVGMWNSLLLLWCAFFAGLVAYLTYDKFDPAFATLLIVFASLAAGMFVMILGSYVFGAAWDDRNFMAMLGGKSGPPPGPGMDDVQ